MGRGDGTFTYQVCDTVGSCDSATVTVQVTATLPEMHVGNIAMSALKTWLGTWQVKVQIQILDASGRAVQGAVVHATWTLADGSTVSQRATTNTSGNAAFSVNSKFAGTYRVCVTDVTKSGYRYDPSQNAMTCGEKKVW